MTKVPVSPQTTYSPPCSPSCLIKWHHHQPVIQGKHLERPLIPPLVHFTSNPQVSSAQNVLLLFNSPMSPPHWVKAPPPSVWLDSFISRASLQMEIVFLYLLVLLLLFFLGEETIFLSRLQVILDAIYWYLASNTDQVIKFPLN